MLRGLLAADDNVPCLAEGFRQAANIHDGDEHALPQPAIIKMRPLRQRPMNFSRLVKCSSGNIASGTEARGRPGSGSAGH